MTTQAPYRIAYAMPGLDWRELAPLERFALLAAFAFFATVYLPAPRSTSVNGTLDYK